MGAHNEPKEMFYADHAIADPGDTYTIVCDQWGSICDVVTTAAQTRTLAQPTKTGVMVVVNLKTDGGDLTLTVTGGYNADADTTITYGDAGDWVAFYSIDVGGSYYWRILQKEGTDATSGGLGAMIPGSGILGTATAAGGNVVKVGPVFKTEIFIDLTGLNSGTAAGDIIGKTLTANCHIGKITAAKNGTIVYGQLTCLETPATGDPDVDFYGTVTESTGTQDAAISALTGESLLLNNGDWTGAVATPIALTALPGPGYLYMVDGGGTAATYTAGQFLLELWGV